MAENPYIAAVGKLPVFIVRAKDQLLKMPVYVDDVLTAPTSGTITIYDAGGNKIVDGAAVTIGADDIATYELLATSIPATTQLSEDWLIEWTLVMDTGDADDEVLIVRQPAQLHLRKLYPVVTTGDLLAKHSDLNTLLPSGKTSWVDFVEDAWVEVETYLMQQGYRPWLIINAWVLRTVHRYIALGAIYRDLSTYTQGAGKYAELADRYEGKPGETGLVEKAWSKVVLQYDETEEGWPGNATEEAGEAIIYLCDNPGGR